MRYARQQREWDQFKQILNALPISIQFSVREIWWAALGTNVGTEMDGKGEDFKRPVLIIKKFNNEQGWIVPITSSSKTKYDIQIRHNALGEYSFVRVSQLRTISHYRLLRRIGTLSSGQFSKITSLVKLLL